MLIIYCEYMQNILLKAKSGAWSSREVCNSSYISLHWGRSFRQIKLVVTLIFSNFITIKFTFNDKSVMVFNSLKSFMQTCFENVFDTPSLPNFRLYWLQTLWDGDWNSFCVHTISSKLVFGWIVKILNKIYCFWVFHLQNMFFLLLFLNQINITACWKKSWLNSCLNALISHKSNP